MTALHTQVTMHSHVLWICTCIKLSNQTNIWSGSLSQQKPWLSVTSSAYCCRSSHYIEEVMQKLLFLCSGLFMTLLALHRPCHMLSTQYFTFPAMCTTTPHQQSPGRQCAQHWSQLCSGLAERSGPGPAAAASWPWFGHCPNAEAASSVEWPMVVEG